jgi:hypothetical protein
MKQTSDKLKLRDSGFLFILFIGGIFVILGLFMGGFFGYFVGLLGLMAMIFAEIETATFDKNLGHMTIKRHKPLIAKTKVVKHLIQDICGVEIQKSYGSESYLYRVCLVLESGKRRVPLTSSFSNGLKDKHKTAEVIATFLDIRNYGLDGFPSQQIFSEELQWKTVEEEILH